MLFSFTAPGGMHDVCRSVTSPLDCQPISEVQHADAPAPLEASSDASTDVIVFHVETSSHVDSPDRSTNENKNNNNSDIEAPADDAERPSTGVDLERGEGHSPEQVLLLEGEEGVVGLDETFSSNDSEQTDMAGLNVNAVSQLPLLFNGVTGILENVTSRVFFVFRPDFRKASKTFALTSPKSTTCPCRCPSSPTATPSVSDVII